MREDIPPRDSGANLDAALEREQWPALFGRDPYAAMMQSRRRGELELELAEADRYRRGPASK